MNLERELHTIFAEKETMKGEAIIFLASHSQTDEKRGKRGNGQEQGLLFFFFFFQLGVKQSKETACVNKVRLSRESTLACYTVYRQGNYLSRPTPKTANSAPNQHSNGSDRQSRFKLL